MENLKRHTPDGAQDCLPAECYIKKDIEKRIRSEFINCGYDEVETPSFEYYDVFASGVGSYMQENMIKFFDSKGRILVLKPDITVPIARLYSTHYASGRTVRRFFYIQNAYSFEKTEYGKSSEYTQAGIELIGEKGCGADAEVISLAIKALKKAGLKKFNIDIGQVGFFKSLIAGNGLDNKTVDAIRHNIDIKNMFELETVLEASPLDDSAKDKLKKLPALFGGEEVLALAERICDAPECRKALKNLKDVYALLCGCGLKEYITIDLGMLHDIAYYSGIIFRGLASGIGFPVLSGGRYDSLIKEFGCDAPATGFAMGIKRVMIALEKQGMLEGYYKTDLVVGADKKYFSKAYSYCEELRAKGKRVVFDAQCDKKSIKALKDEYKAQEALYFDRTGDITKVE